MCFENSSSCKTPKIFKTFSHQNFFSKTDKQCKSNKHFTNDYSIRWYHCYTKSFLREYFLLFLSIVTVHFTRTLRSHGAEHVPIWSTTTDRSSCWGTMPSSKRKHWAQHQARKEKKKSMISASRSKFHVSFSIIAELQQESWLHGKPR